MSAASELRMTALNLKRPEPLHGLSQKHSTLYVLSRSLTAPITRWEVAAFRQIRVRAYLKDWLSWLLGHESGRTASCFWVDEIGDPVGR